MHVLLKFSHGLGDGSQFTCVLQHLAKYRPEWTIDVASKLGKHSAFHGQCRRSWVLDRDSIPERGYGHVFDLGWFECYSIFDDSPSTKVCNCLREVFGIVPDLSLLKYRIEVSDEARDVTQRYLSQICNGHAALLSPIGTVPTATAEPVRTEADGDCDGQNEGALRSEDDSVSVATASPPADVRASPGRRFPVVAIHYQGNTSAEKKNLAHPQIAALCRELIKRGYAPLILDWDRRSPLPDGKSIFCPGVGPDDLWDNTGTGDAERLAALISQCALMIGVDSGPLHVAGATDTPTIAVWTGHMPVQFFDLCDNVTHLVPEQWRTIPPCQNPTAARFMEEHYTLRTYRDLDSALIETALAALDGTSTKLGAPRFGTAHQARVPPAVAAAGNGKLNGSKTNGFTGHLPPQLRTRRPSMDTSILTIPALVSWEQMAGSATEIAVGADDSVWSLGIREIEPDGRSIHRWNGSEWDEIAGTATKIAVGPDGTAFAINSRGQIHRHTGTEWQPMPGLAREIAVGADGALWCVSAADFAPGGGSIHRWNGSDWDRAEGAAIKIAVGPDG
ncbi:MAG: hypothetical protein HY290_07395 [Planctomycetia bacterium]|nr:hypothetical protein [Planctomycetia bacterium]